MIGNGHVIPSTPLAIDMWDIKNHPEARIFFLSHFHADHIVGLNSSWNYPIYASPITCKFLIKKLKINTKLVKSLEVAEDHLIPLDPDGKEMATVTLFDANHCPGSVMFLFSGYFGDIFYTGDFRYVSNILDGFQLPPIDVLYLDNTYCSPKCIFPAREDAIDKILFQLSTCLVQSKRVFIGLDNLGKEDLLQKISKEQQCRLNFYPARKQILDILGMSNIITDDKVGTKIFVVPTNQISGRNLARWNEDVKTHAILATARYCGLSFEPFAKFQDIHVIPYSNHSSYFELKNFVKQIKPSKIIPIVNKNAKGIFGTDISDRADMSVFNQFLRKSKSLDFVIPETVKKFMVTSEMSATPPLSISKRKIARRIERPMRRPIAVGVRYIVSEDSETDSDPDAIHIESTPPAAINITEYCSDDSDSSESDETWEFTNITKAGVRVYFAS